MAGYHGHAREEKQICLLLEASCVMGRGLANHCVRFKIGDVTFFVCPEGVLCLCIYVSAHLCKHKGTHCHKQLVGMSKEKGSINGMRCKEKMQPIGHMKSEADHVTLLTNCSHYRVKQFE